MPNSRCPAGRAAADEDEDDGPAGPPAPAMRPRWPPTSRTPPPASPWSSRPSAHDFEGEDKRKQDRVRKFYAAIPDVVELQKYSPQEARAEAESLIRQGRLPHGTRRAGPADRGARRGDRARRRGDREARLSSPAIA